MWEGCTVFLVCGGPSLSSMDLSPLGERGVVTMALNNAWLVVRPNLWMCVDSPGRFSHVGWEDPAVIKMVPRGYARSRYRVMGEGGRDGEKEEVWRLPGVFLYGRREGHEMVSFWRPPDPMFQWGVPGGGRSVFMTALSMCSYLGFERIVLVGADFRMPKEGSPYGWDEEKEEGARERNNAMYWRMRGALARLVKVEGSPRIVNATPGSALREVEMVDLRDEVEAVKRTPTVTRGWYAKRSR